jgi:hypothetical protein
VREIMKKITYSIAISIILFVAGCSTTEKVTKKEELPKEKVVEVKNDLDLKIEQSSCWVNLMPGSEPKFHTSGKFILDGNGDYNLQNIELKFIKVFQSGNELYYIIPKVIENESTNSKDVTYSTIRGLSINPDMNVKKPVNLVFIFKDGGNDLKYYLNNIQVEEVH